MRNPKGGVDMGGEIPHIILCNMTLEKAQEIIGTVLGDGGVYMPDFKTKTIQAQTADGYPYVFILNDILTDEQSD